MRKCDMKTAKQTFQYIFQWLCLSLMIAIIGGSLVSIYLLLINEGEKVRAHYQWIILLLPFVGALCAYLYQRMPAQVGNNWLIHGVNQQLRPMPWRALPISFFGTIASHWVGASIGREDIATQLIGNVTMNMTQSFSLSKTQRQYLMMAVIGAGFSAAFGTPIAATFFAMEVVKRRHIHVDALFPIALTSLFTYGVTCLYRVPRRPFDVGGIPEFEFSALWLLVIASLCFGAVGFFYYKGIGWIQKLASRWLKQPIWIAMSGGIILLIFVMLTKSTTYLGLSTVLQQKAIEGHVSFFDFLWKDLYTIFSVGTGFRGGMMTPLFDIGATFGNSLGQLLHVNPHFMASLGLVGIFSAATNTPLTCFVLGVELFGGDGALYYFIVSILSCLFSGHWSVFATQKESVYENML